MAEVSAGLGGSEVCSPALALGGMLSGSGDSGGGAVGKGFLGKHEDLSLDPQNAHKSWGCDHSTRTGGERMMGGSWEFADRQVQ